MVSYTRSHHVEIDIARFDHGIQSKTAAIRFFSHHTDIFISVHRKKLYLIKKPNEIIQLIHRPRNIQII